MIEIRTELLKLIEEKKTPMHNQAPFERYTWNVDQQEIKNTMLECEGMLFVPIKQPEINWIVDETDQELRNHAMELELASNDCFLRQPQWQDQTCRFCNFHWDQIQSLKLHIKTTRHLKRVEKYLK